MKLNLGCTRAVAIVLACLLGLALTAQPVAAGPLNPPSSAAPAGTPMAAAASAKVASLTPAQLASVSPQASEPAPSTSSPAFFKTGKGIAVLILVAAGVGYASYSAVNDREPVKSPIR